MSDLDPKQALAHIKTILTQGASGTQQAFGGVGPKAVAHATFSGTPILTNTAGLIGAGGVGALKLAGSAGLGTLGLGAKGIAAGYRGITGRRAKGDKTKPATTEDVEGVKGAIEGDAKEEEKKRSLLGRLLDSIKDSKKNRLQAEEERREGKKKIGPHPWMKGNGLTEDEVEQKTGWKGMLALILGVLGGVGLLVTNFITGFWTEFKLKFPAFKNPFTMINTKLGQMGRWIAGLWADLKGRAWGKFLGGGSKAWAKVAGWMDDAGKFISGIGERIRNIKFTKLKTIWESLKSFAKVPKWMGTLARVMGVIGGTFAKLMAWPVFLVISTIAGVMAAIDEFEKSGSILNALGVGIKNAVDFLVGGLVDLIFDAGVWLVTKGLELFGFDDAAASIREFAEGFSLTDFIFDGLSLAFGAIWNGVAFVINSMIEGYNKIPMLDDIDWRMEEMNIAHSGQGRGEGGGASFGTQEGATGAQSVLDFDQRSTTIDAHRGIQAHGRGDLDSTATFGINPHEVIGSGIKSLNISGGGQAGDYNYATGGFDHSTIDTSASLKVDDGGEGWGGIWNWMTGGGKKVSGTIGGVPIDGMEINDAADVTAIMEKVVEGGGFISQADVRAGSLNEMADAQTTEALKHLEKALMAVATGNIKAAASQEAAAAASATGGGPSVQAGRPSARPDRKLLYDPSGGLPNF